MVSRVLYIVSVNLAAKGSYMSHVEGFIHGCRKLNVKISTLGIARYGQRSNEYLLFAPTKSLILNQVLFDFYSGLFLIFNHRSYDVVVFRPYRFSFFTPILSRYLGIKLLKENNGIIPEELRINGNYLQASISAAIDKFVSHMVSANVCVSSGVFNYYRRLNIAPLILAPNGMAENRIYNRKSKLDIAKSINFLFIGKLTKWQGIDSFIDYISSIDDNSQISLTIIGDGVLKEKVLEKALLCSLDIRFVGWSSWEEICRLSENCNVGIIPRRNTDVSGSPLKYMDYLSLGLPVLTTRIDGVKDLSSGSQYTQFFDYETPVKETLSHLRIAFSGIQELDLSGLLEFASWAENAKKVLSL